jgi:hypothetical protein
MDGRASASYEYAFKEKIKLTQTWSISTTSMTAAPSSMDTIWTPHQFLMRLTCPSLMVIINVQYNRDAEESDEDQSFQ